jgi:phosphatidylglycerol:prolipoprotein diacylglycerol transferase
MHPILIDLGFKQLHTYGLMLALGFLAALLFCRHESKRIGLNPALVPDLLLWVIGGGIIGARLLYVVIHAEEFTDVVSIFAIWKGGLVYYGGFAGGVTGGIIFARRHKIKVLDLADLSMPAAMLGQGIGRWGCFMAGCCYGKQVDASFPLGVAFPASKDSLIPANLQNPDMAHPTVFLHPTQLYMSFNALVLFLVCWWLFRHRKHRGVVTGVLLVLYAVTRSCIEMLRGDYLERVFFGPLSTSQWASVPLLLFGLYLLITCRPRPVPAAPALKEKQR